MASSRPDVCIAGAGVIGLMLALELQGRGASVVVLDAGQPLGQASSAAAGMLAAHDPENPPQMQALADLSLELYPEFLGRIEEMSGAKVPFQTERTLQALPPEHAGATTLSETSLREICPGLSSSRAQFFLLEEHSLDPLQLGAALLAAARAAKVQIHAGRAYTGVQIRASEVSVATSAGVISAGKFVDCTGAWSARPVGPKKGQMLAVELPGAVRLDVVVRTAEVYIVPRTHGPQAGRAVIGATVEDAGFDTETRVEDIARLRMLASELLPALAEAEVVEQWAGLRPGTPDELPILGSTGERSYVAAGHYRNGILLAPATAKVLAQVLAGEAPAVDLDAFSPQRFAAPFR